MRYSTISRLENGLSEIKFAHHMRGSVADPNPSFFLDVFGSAGSGSVSLMYGSRSAPDQDPSFIKQK